MPQIAIYSKASCVKCDASLRVINKAVAAEVIPASSVTVYMIDGSEPRQGKVHPGIGVIRIEDTTEQDALREALKERVGPVAPIFVLTDDGTEILSWGDFRPDKLTEAIQVFSCRTGLASTSA